MAHRGLRKPSSRRSLRPRNHGPAPRTAAESSPAPRDRRDRSDRPAPRGVSSVTESGPVPRSDGELDSAPEAAESESENDALEPASAGIEPASAEAPALAPFERPATPPPPTLPASEHALHDHDDPLAEAFFRHPDKPVIDVWEEDHAPVVHTMSRGSRRAMFASIGIFAVSILGITSYSVYQNWIMPAPAELGASAGDLPATLPTPPSPPPAAAQETQLAAATNPAPAPQPAALPDPEPAPAPQPETLAAIAARQPAPDPSGAEPKVEGTTGEHLRASAEETARAADRLHERAPAAVPVTGAITGSLRGAADPRPPQETPVRAFVTTAGAPTYDELVEVGRDLSKRNRRVEASEAFRRALLKSPQGSAALSGLSYVYLNAEENQTARAYAQRAVQSDATNAEGWIVLGAALEMLGDKAGAQDAYRSCVQRGKGPYLLECRRVLR